MNEFISILFQSRTQAHVFHLETLHYSEHKALQNYYDEIVGLADGLAESYQGIYGRLSGFQSKPIIDWKEGLSSDYFKKLYDYVQSTRKDLEQDSWIQNEIDAIAELIADTLYMLTLKG